MGFATGGKKAPSPTPPPMFSTGIDPSMQALPTKHIVSPRTVASVKTWLRLQKVVAISFAEETPLEDVLKFIKLSSHDESSKSGTFSIYVDPVGLQEADRTMTSPVTLALEGQTLETSLKLMLDQIGLVSYIRDDGIIFIDNKDSETPHIEDPQAVMLDTLSTLRTEVAALRWEVATMRAGVPLTTLGNASGVGGWYGSLSSGGAGCNFR